MDNGNFVREFRNSMYGDDGYENVSPAGSLTELDLSGRFVVNNSYGKVNCCEDGDGISDKNPYADPNEFKGSRSSAASPELLDNPLYEVVEESSLSTGNREPGQREYGMLDEERNGPEGPVESRPRRNKSSTSAEEYSELER